MQASEIHPSHELIDYFNDYADYHESQWKCTVCEESACQNCPLDYDDALAEPCIGFSWLKALTVEGPDGITRTVRKSGTGWPKPPKKTT